MATPAASASTIVSAQIPQIVREQLQREAVANDRTLSAEVRRILAAHVRELEQAQR
jgi:hypothetical protein